jgi:electron transfer flavoprotein beta subunit
MNIGICIKRVPASDSRIMVTSDGSAIDTSSFNKYEINPYDEFVIEEAVSLKDAGKADKVIVYTIDGKEGEGILRSALAQGADSAVLIKDVALSGSDCLGIATALAAAVKEDDISLLFCGKQAIDGDNAQVPIMIAEILGWGHANTVTKFEIDGETYKAWCELGSGSRGIIQGDVPAVITCDKGLNKPRFPKLKERMKAKKKPLKVVDIAALGVDSEMVGASNTRYEETHWQLPPQREECQFIEGDVQSAVSELIRRLREDVKVL